MVESLEAGLLQTKNSFNGHHCNVDIQIILTGVIILHKYSKVNSDELFGHGEQGGKYEYENIHATCRENSSSDWEQSKIVDERAKYFMMN